MLAYKTMPPHQLRASLAAGVIGLAAWTAPLHIARGAEPGPAETPGAAQAHADAKAAIDGVANVLEKRFDASLDKPDAYREIVRKECAIFPEGDLFPYVLPALGYVNRGLSDPARMEGCRTRVRQLIDLAIPAVVRKVGPSGGTLANLDTYRHHATYLGMINLALGGYRLIGGDDRYEAVHKTLTDVLAKALLENEGRPLDSYPSLCWPFDTIPCLLSLKLRDKIAGMTRTEPLLRRHLEWVERSGTDPALGLPVSRMDKAGKPSAPPRGCDLSFRLCLLVHLDRAQAENVYKKYMEAFWIDRGIVSGFAEWPHGKDGPADADSGPIVLGIGLSATGLGIGAARAMGDEARQASLARQLANLQAFRRLAESMDKKSGGAFAIPLSDRYVTGFLYGDACLFYAATWTPWFTAGR
jgi:hypothetical protein